MTSERKHQACLTFAREVVNVAAQYSKEDLVAFREVAEVEYNTLVPVIDAYIQLMKRSETLVPFQRATQNRPSAKSMHLFDLLREKTFFPQNLDLARFAAPVVPEMRTNRFDKMSRGDIAARIIEYIENSDPKTKSSLQESMRQALSNMRGPKPKEEERRSFLEKWERIIKGIDS